MTGMMLHTISVLTLSILPILAERLPEDVIPRHYDVEMEINPEELSFTGEVCINIDCQAKTEEIKLHGKQKYNHLIINYDMKITGLTQTSNPPHIKDYEYNKDSDILTIKTSELERYGKYRLCIRYKGEISEEHNYVIWKTEEQPDCFTSMFKKTPVKKYIIATNFERQSAFPCFDEPNLIATFTLKLNLPASTQSYSNDCSTRQTIKSKDPPRVQDTYRMDNKVPPSQISFAITNREVYTQSYTRNDLDITFVYLRKRWSAKKKKHITDINLPESIVPKYTLSYKPKMNIIVIPTDVTLVSFKVGLALISESDVLQSNPDVWTYEFFSRVYSPMFGGVVSSESSESSWLLTALTQLIIYIQMPDQPWLQDLATPMYESPSKILDTNMIKGVDIFQEDTVGTTRGFLFLLMIRSVAGEKLFIDTIDRVYKTYQFSLSIGPHKLWKEIDGIGLRIKGIKPDFSWSTVMEPWTQQPSYPLVTVTAIAGGRFKVAQEYFIGSYKKKIQKQLNKDKINSESDCRLIPLLHRTFGVRQPSEGGLFLKWLNCEEKETIIYSKAKDQEIVLFNQGYSSFYRVKYDEESWMKIVLTVPTIRQDVRPIVRAQLVHDAFSLSWLGYQDYKYVFSMSPLMENENSYYVWNAFFSGAFNFNEILKTSPKTYEVFQKFIRVILEPTFESKYEQTLFTFLDHNVYPVTSRMNASFLFWACNVARFEICRNRAKDLFQTWTQSHSTLIDTFKDSRFDSTIVYTVMCTVVGGTHARREEDFNKYFELLRDDYHDENSPERELPKFRAEYFKVLRCLKEPSSITRILEWISEDSSMLQKATKHEKVKAFLGLTRGPDSIQPTLDYFYENIDKILLYHNDEAVLAEFVKALTTNMKMDQVNKMKDFIEAKPKLKKDNVLQAFEQGKSAASLRSKWLEENDEKIRNYLTTKYTT